MTIIRHTLKTTLVPNELVTDTTISAESFRVMTYLFSLSVGEEVNICHISDILGFHKDETLKYFDELVCRGWIIRTLITNVNGNDYDYEINETPIQGSLL